MQSAVAARARDARPRATRPARAVGRGAARARGRLRARVARPHLRDARGVATRTGPPRWTPSLDGRRRPRQRLPARSSSRARGCTRGCARGVAPGARRRRRRRAATAWPTPRSPRPGSRWYEVCNWAARAGGPLRAQPRLLALARLVGARPGRALARRRRALVERPASRALRRAPGAGRSPAAGARAARPPRSARTERTMLRHPPRRGARRSTARTAAAGSRRRPARSRGARARRRAADARRPRSLADHVARELLSAAPEPAEAQRHRVPAWPVGDPDVQREAADQRQPLGARRRDAARGRARRPRASRGAERADSSTSPPSCTTASATASETASSTPHTSTPSPSVNSRSALAHDREARRGGRQVLFERGPHGWDQGFPFGVRPNRRTRTT